MWVYWSAFAVVNLFVLGGSLAWAFTSLESGEAILISIVIILTVAAVVLLIRSQFPPQNPFQQVPARGQEGQPAGNNNPDSPSADFAALINTITAEGRADRSEEQREDRGKALRDWLTIVLLGCTTIGVFWQVHEMIKVYGPIQQQAAATTSAQRAWVGPLTVTVPTVQKDKSIVGTIPYQNTGREPAADFYPAIFPKVYSLDDWNSGKASQDIMAQSASCLKITGLPNGLQVVYPSTGFSS